MRLRGGRGAGPVQQPVMLQEILGHNEHLHKVVFIAHCHGRYVLSWWTQLQSTCWDKNLVLRRNKLGERKLPRFLVKVSHYESRTKLPLKLYGQVQDCSREAGCPFPFRCLYVTHGIYILVSMSSGRQPHICDILLYRK